VQSLSLHKFEEMMDKIRLLADAMGRSLPAVTRAGS